MKHFIYAGIHILTLFAATSAQADAWYDKWMGIMDNIGSVPESERIETLSRVLGVGKKQALTPEESTVFNRAQSNLLAIPGHATYYQDKIESMRAEVLANAKKSEEELNAVLTDGRELANEWSYDRYCFLAFQTLQLMPSAETVAVLGHFLNDPEGRDGKSLVGSSLAGSDDSQGRSFNAMMAAMTIGNLGIEHPPYIIPGTLGATFIDAWKDWWNEVAAGKRTYRFTGSSIEYGPDGPVSAEKLQSIERDRRRDEERAAGHRPTPSAAASAATTTSPATAITHQTSFLAGIVAAVAGIVAALWYFLRVRSRRTG